MLLNPASGKVKKKIHHVRKIISDIPGVIVAEATCPEEFIPILDSFYLQKITNLIIIAGDGTVQSALSYYISISKGDKIPNILILPGGTTNMTASDIGIKGFEVNLKKTKNIFAGNLQTKHINKPLLKIELQDKPAMYGFFFGAGIIASGVKYFNKHIKKSGLTGEIISIAAIVPFIFKLLLAPESNKLGQAMLEIETDGVKKKPMCTLVFFATTLDRLLYGLRPYWGNTKKPIHVTFIKAQANRLWRSLISIIFNRGHYLNESDGYNSFNNHKISMRLNSSYIIDGEIFNSENHNIQLNLSTTEPVTFIVP